MYKKQLVIFFLTFFFSSNILASQRSIENKIAQIEKTYKVKIGISAIHIESGRFINYRSDERFQMASTEKLPIAIHLLHLVECGKIKLDQMLDLAPSDASLGSGMLGYYLTYPGLSISVMNLLEPMMLISDNAASDAILRLSGGPKKTYEYLKHNGYGDIYVNRSIMEIYGDTSGLKTVPPKSTWTLKKWRSWKENAPAEVKRRQYKAFFDDDRDTTTPSSMTHLLVGLYNNSLLNKENSELLLSIMNRSCDGDRLNRFLPSTVKIAHKTGTWWDIDIASAKYGYCNDVGILYLPDNQGHIAISLYSSSDKQGDVKKHAIAVGKVSRLVYDRLVSEL